MALTNVNTFPEAVVRTVSDDEDYRWCVAEDHRDFGSSTASVHCVWLLNSQPARRKSVGVQRVVVRLVCFAVFAMHGHFLSRLDEKPVIG